MAIIPIKSGTFFAHDNETNEVLLCEGNAMGDFRVLGPAIQGVDIKASTVLHTSALFAATGKTEADIEYISVVQAGAGTVALKAAQTGHRVFLLGLQGTMTVTGKLEVQDTGGIVLSGDMDLAAASGFGLPNGLPMTVSPMDLGLQLVSTTGGFNGMAQILVV